MNEIPSNKREIYDREGDTPNFETKIDLILLEAGYGGVISERARAGAAEILRSVYGKYGREDSDTYLPRHNDNHAIAVMQRALKLWKILSELLPNKFHKDDIELLILAAAGHDLEWRSGEEMGIVEKESAMQTAHIMQVCGYDDSDISRVDRMIMSTAISIDEESRILQPYLRQGDKDPLRYIVAMADINGIAMEGKEAMYNEAFALYREASEQSSKQVLFDPRRLVDLLMYQAQFLRDRFREKSDDITYFFEEDAEAVEKVFDEIFSDTFGEAVKEANILVERHMAERAIVSALGGAAEMVVQTTEVLEMLKNTLRRYLK